MKDDSDCPPAVAAPAPPPPAVAPPPAPPTPAAPARDPRVPPPSREPDLSGVYESQWSSGDSVLTLTHTGDFVVGTFTNPPGVQPGALSGVLDAENVLRGRWSDATSSGGFTLVFGPAGMSFRGTWGRTLDSTDNGGAWSGQRVQ